MTSKRTNVGMSSPARLLVRGVVLAWIVCSALVPAPVRAEVAVYQAIVPMHGTTEAERQVAFGAALKVAAVCATGRPEAATTAKVVAAAAAPMSFVQQYSTTPDRQLKVGFDARAVDQLLTQAGLPWWPAERPTVTVLLFTPGVAGGARAVLATERGSARSEVERLAQSRGVPLGWPNETLDPGAARARLTSERAVLLGLGSGNSYEWVFSHAGATSRTQGGLSDGVALAADTLAARYAPASTRSVTTVRLSIGGLRSVRDYAALTEYLEGLSLVRGIAVRELQRDTVQLELQVRGDLELLRRILALDGRLTRAGEASPGTPVPVDFAWAS